MPSRIDTITITRATYKPGDREQHVRATSSAQPNATLTVDLESQTIKGPDGGEIKFNIEADRKQRLLNGIDDIGESMQKNDAIDKFEAKMHETRPWV